MANVMSGTEERRMSTTEMNIEYGANGNGREPVEGMIDDLSQSHLCHKSLMSQSVSQKNCDKSPKY